MKSRRLSAIMFTDIVGYTAMMQENELDGLTKVRRYSKVMEEQVQAHHGQILQFQGDGSLSIFHSAVEAMYAAQAIQEHMQMDPVIPLRIGIHIGDIVIQDGNIYGDGVNLASRVESMGVPGSVLVTEQVIPNLKSHPEFQMTSLGKFSFKNVEKPMEVFALTNEGFSIPNRKQIQGKFKQVRKSYSNVLWAAIVLGITFLMGAFLIYQSQPDTQPIQAVANFTVEANSVAVLPFTNMNRDEDGELFCAGMQEDILTYLARFKDIKVISRTSAMQYKDTDKKIPQIASELGVAHIVEGSVRIYGDKARITVQLIRAADDLHLWAENYDRELKDIFAVQSEVSQKIVEALQMKITQAESMEMKPSLTDNTEAYQYFLRGKRAAEERSKEGLAKSVVQLEAAIKHDTNFADAYANLAFSKFLQGAYEFEEKEQARKEAEEFAKMAIQHDDKNTLAYTVLGGVKQLEGKLGETKELIAKAIKISPNGVFPHHALGQYYAETGEAEKELEHRKKVLDLDPLIEVYHTNYVEALLKNDFTEEAKRQLKKMEHLFPSTRKERKGHQGIIHVQEGNYAEAVQELESGVNHNPRLVGALGYAYAKIHEMDKVDDLLDKLEDEEPKGYQKHKAIIYVGMEDYDHAIDELEDWVDERGNKEWVKSFLLKDPLLKDLRKDPRFDEMLKDLGIKK